MSFLNIYLNPNGILMKKLHLQESNMFLTIYFNCILNYYMKRLFLVAAIFAAVVTTSCSTTESNEVNDRLVELRITEEKKESQPKKRGEFERLSEYLDRIRGTAPKRKK